MDKGNIIHEMPGCRVVNNGDGTVTKSGRRISSEEVAALNLAYNAGLPVPRVHSSGLDQDGNFSITMDYIEGESLEKVWPSMSDQEKGAIALQMRTIIEKMRSAERRPPSSPESDAFISSCSGGPIHECRLISPYSGGPFKKEGDLNNFILDFVGPPPKAFLNAFQRRLPTDSRIMLAHGDLSQHNIFVNAGKIVAIIDWEFAGWFPEYWDYIKFFLHWAPKDWKNYSDTIFPTAYEDVLLDYEAIYRWQKN